MLRMHPRQEVLGGKPRHSVDWCAVKSALGWTLLSREALKRAETQLRDELQGVRDKVGFLRITSAGLDLLLSHLALRHRTLEGLKNRCF